MADAVTNKTVSDGRERLCIHLTNISDGTGEAAVVKADKSTFTASDGAEPASLDIEQVRWNIQGFTSVRILWDHTTDDVGLVLSGNGYEDFRGDPGFRADVTPRGLADPRSAGDTGDILLTTAGTTSGNTYDITLWLRKSPD